MRHLMETPEEGGAKAGTFYLLGNIRSGPEGRVEGEGRRGVGTEDGPGNGRFFTTAKGEERRQAAHETHRTKRRSAHRTHPRPRRQRLPRKGVLLQGRGNPDRRGRGEAGRFLRAPRMRDDVMSLSGAKGRAPETRRRKQSFVVRS